METDTRAGGLGTEGDLSFHMAIAMGTKNPLQVYIMKNVSDFLHFGIRENLLHLYEIRITSWRYCGSTRPSIRPFAGGMPNQPTGP
jgi:DNA-binding FadR family transcriptional regulator